MQLRAPDLAIEAAYTYSRHKLPHLRDSQEQAAFQTPPTHWWQRFGDHSLLPKRETFLEAKTS
ncbi:hypothetical protein KSC_029740 [Ktedonobacter sp. SOSP1-52]|nr:hypothetical protein KSC_029740 [Ktedonobacter sp. SOSP1-52]